MGLTLKGILYGLETKKYDITRPGLDASIRCKFQTGWDELKFAYFSTLFAVYDFRRMYYFWHTWLIRFEIFK